MMMFVKLILIASLVVSPLLIISQGGPGLPGSGSAEAEYSNETPMLFDAITSLTRSVPTNTDFEHTLWIEDFDEWIRSSDDSILSRPNYDTNYTPVFKSCALRGAITPNPVVTRPSSGRNKFNYFVKANSVDETTIYVDKFTPYDFGGSSNPSTTNDGTGSTISVVVTVVKP